MKFTEFFVTYEVISASQQIASNCADITFINMGTVPVSINNVLKLDNKDSVTDAANVGELNKTSYSATFDFVDPINSKLIVKRKFYKGYEY